MDSEILEIYERALKYANARRNMLSNYKEPEDFAAYVVERKLKGRVSQIGFMFIDYLREDSGRKGSVGYDKRLSKEKTSYRSEYVDQYSTDELTDVGSGRTNYHCTEDLEQLLSIFKQNSRKRRIIEMTMEGYNLKEIGDHFGFSESRACQLLKAASDDLEKESFKRMFLDSAKLCQF